MCFTYLKKIIIISDSEDKEFVCVWGGVFLSFLKNLSLLFFAHFCLNVKKYNTRFIHFLKRFLFYETVQEDKLID